MGAGGRAGATSSRRTTSRRSTRAGRGTELDGPDPQTAEAPASIRGEPRSGPSGRRTRTRSPRPPVVQEGSIRTAAGATPALRRTTSHRRTRADRGTEPRELPPGVTSKRTTGARGAERSGLSAARPPGAVGAGGLVQRDQHACQPRGLSFLSSSAHENHRSIRMTSLLREELRATATGKAGSTLFL